MYMGYAVLFQHPFTRETEPRMDTNPYEYLEHFPPQVPVHRNGLWQEFHDRSGVAHTIERSLCMKINSCSFVVPLPQPVSFFL